MYVVTHNDQVILGPIPWSARMFSSVIEDDLEIKVTIFPSQKNSVPLDLGNGIKIRMAVEDRPSLNPKIQMHTGPFWTFTDTTGTHSYVPVDKPIELVKQELKQVAAAERWKKEHSGVKVTVQGTDVTVDTARGARDIFVQKYLLMADGETTTWKFPEGWLTLTKSELGQCVAAGVQHVQTQFNWESGIVDQINAAQTLQELDALVIVEEPVRPGLGV